VRAPLIKGVSSMCGLLVRASQVYLFWLVEIKKRGAPRVECEGGAPRVECEGGAPRVECEGGAPRVVRRWA
jgi:hypothetical protein